MRPQTVINQINEIFNTEGYREKVYNFLNKFSQCEVYARYFLEKYLDDIAPEDIALIREDIISAFNENGIYFDDERIITFIFGKGDKSQKRACRILRNKITHKLNKTCVNKVVTRYEELISTMNNFIQIVDEQS
ncbi:MAG: hypothetical protein E7254_11690 [Lachnospiraceae bacterium]|nr:hypothetical protein [Lachnospiraceae bacterium]